MSAARRGLRKTWRWPTLGFSASRPETQQRLAHLLGQGAVVAGEAAREVGELGVVAAPLAHAVEALQDPAGDAAGRIGVIVRTGDAVVRRGLQDGDDGVLVLGVARRDRRAGRRAARLQRDQQRMRRADRRA